MKFGVIMMIKSVFFESITERGITWPSCKNLWWFHINLSNRPLVKLFFLYDLFSKYFAAFLVGNEARAAQLGIYLFPSPIYVYLEIDRIWEFSENRSDDAHFCVLICTIVLVFNPNYFFYEPNLPIFNSRFYIVSKIVLIWALYRF